MMTRHCGCSTTRRQSGIALTHSRTSALHNLENSLHETAPAIAQSNLRWHAWTGSTTRQANMETFNYIPLASCIRGNPWAVVLLTNPMYRFLNDKSCRCSYPEYFSDVFALYEQHPTVFFVVGWLSENGSSIFSRERRWEGHARIELSILKSI